MPPNLTDFKKKCSLLSFSNNKQGKLFTNSYALRFTSFIDVYTLSIFRCESGMKNGN